MASRTSSPAALAALTAASLCLPFLVHAQTSHAQRELDLSAPLGSIANPVRASTPSGQRDYLMRLRCPEGDAPTFERIGSMGAGPYGSIIDKYSVRCASGQSFEIVMDMYHRHRELEAVPGLTVLPEHPAFLAPGCPPEVPGIEPGAYVFHGLEVRRAAVAKDFRTDLDGRGMTGSAFARFVIDTDGKVTPETVEFPYPVSPPELKPLTIAYLTSLMFEPAQQKPGCAVPIRSEARFTFR